MSRSTVRSWSVSRASRSLPAPAGRRARGVGGATSSKGVPPAATVRTADTSAGPRTCLSRKPEAPGPDARPRARPARSSWSAPGSAVRAPGRAARGTARRRRRRAAACRGRRRPAAPPVPGPAPRRRPRLARDRDARVVLEDLGHAATDHLVVVDQEDPDERATGPCGRPPPGTRGSQAVRRLGPSGASSGTAMRSGGQQQRGVEGEARTERHGHDRAVDVGRAPRAPAARSPTSSCRARRAPGGRRASCSSARPSSSRTTSRIRGPPGCTAQPATSSTRRPALGRAAPRRRRRRAGTSTSGTRGDSPMRKPRSVTSHVMWSAVEGSVRATMPASRRPARRARLHDDGGGGVGEQRVRDHLLEVGLRRLDVQAGQLAAQQHGRPGAGGDEVADRGQARDRGVAAHVPDQQPLQPRRHAEVAGQPDVQARGGVAGAGGDGEQADVPGREPGGVQRAGHRLLAQRQRLLDVALHAGAGAPAAEVLVERVGDGVPACGRRRRRRSAGRRARPRSAGRRSPPRRRPGRAWPAAPSPAPVRTAALTGAAPGRAGSASCPDGTYAAVAPAPPHRLRPYPANSTAVSGAASSGPVAAGPAARRWRRASTVAGPTRRRSRPEPVGGRAAAARGRRTAPGRAGPAAGHPAAAPAGAR